MYSKMSEFCKVKNKGIAYENGLEETPRVKWLVKLLKSNNIEFIIDKWGSNTNKFYNIILPGTSGKFITAHHDIVNPKSDNANDNSASVINAIMTKINSPSTTVILLDGEEIGGRGSQRASEKINSGEYGNCNWVLNFELTGKGGSNFFIGNYDNDLSNHIKNIFNCPTFQTPFNDSTVFNRNGIVSTVINPLPILKESGSSKLVHNGFNLDSSILWNCHSHRDSLETIDINDMKEFVEDVVMKILN